MVLTKLFNNFFNPEISGEDSGVIEINGVFEGGISKGREVIITPSGHFYGRIEARNVEIAGFVEGDVHAERLVMYSSGQLYFGKLNCQHVSIKNGGTMINKDKKENSKANDMADKGNTVNASKIEYTPDNGQFCHDIILHDNKHLPDNQETKQLPDKTFAQEVKERESYSSYKQLRFHSSY